MENASAHRTPQVVALLCPEPRLNRLLRVALEADRFCVDGWPAARDGHTSHQHVSAIVADLDSLGWHPLVAAERLSAIGIDGSVPRLLICILPPELALHDAANAAYLQPPFSPREFVECLRSLLAL